MAPNACSKPRWAHLEYRWRLENFWELRALASIEALEDDAGDVIWSQLFGDTKRGLWRLKLYPYGDPSQGGKGHVSLFLSLDVRAAAHAKAYAIFGCYILDSKGEKIVGSGRSFTRQKFAEGSASWGWSQFIKVEDQSLNKMLVEDAMTIKCDIDVFVGIDSGPGRELPAATTMGEELIEYAKEDEAKDLCLKLGNRVFKVNAFILCARARKMKYLLSGTRPPSESAPEGEVKASKKSHVAKETDGADVAPADDAPTTKSNPEDTASAGAAATADPASEVEGVKKEKSDTVPPKKIDASLLAVPGVAPHRFRAVEMTDTDITEEALEALLEYVFNDSCAVLNAVSPPLREILNLFIAAQKLDVPSLSAACVKHLMMRLTSKSDVLSILLVAEQTQCEPLVAECRQFLQYFTTELEGAELIRLLSPGRTLGGHLVERQDRTASASPAKA